MKAKNNLFITSLPFVLVSFMLIVFLVYPTFQDVKHLSGEIASNKERISFLYMQNNELNSFKKNMSAYSLNLNRAEKVFMDPANPVEFVKFLEKAASSLGIQVVINLINTNQGTNVPESAFQVYAVGNLQAMVKFSEQLEHGPYLLSVSRLSLSKELEGTKDISPSASTVGATFIVKIIDKIPQSS